MKHASNAVYALLAGVAGLAFSIPAFTQDCTPRPVQPFRSVEPPGRDLFIPYVPNPAVTAAAQVRSVEQLRMLAEMNRLTVELVKRRSNTYVTSADTPALVKRLKKLAKELQDPN